MYFDTLSYTKIKPLGVNHNNITSLGVYLLCARDYNFINSYINLNICSTICKNIDILSLTLYIIWAHYTSPKNVIKKTIRANTVHDL